MSNNLCCVCGESAKDICTGCHAVFYCSSEHQKQHWKQNESTCKPYKVCRDASLGRYIIATRSIKPGQIVMRENPLIRGPAQKTPPVCLGCYKYLNIEDRKQWTFCYKCGWPMCSKMCENSIDHTAECELSSKRRIEVPVESFVNPDPTYQCLTLLRCLYKKKSNCSVWSKLLVLKSNDEKRKDTIHFEQDKLIAKFIRNFFQLDSEFTEEEILKIADVVHVNGYFVPITEPAHIAIYDEASFLEHSCRANCSKSFTSTSELLVIARMAIEAGEHLSISYIDPLQETLKRRRFLQDTELFSCICNRCSDPTEFGTLYSAIKCQNSTCNGYFLPNSILVENYDKNNKKMSAWFCNICNDEKSIENIKELLDKFENNFQKIDTEDIRSCEKFLNDHSQLLHSSHFYMTRIRMKLAQMIGNNSKSGLMNVSEEDLNLKVRSCQQVIDLLAQLAPGENRTRGILLYELYSGIAETGRRKVSKGEIELESLKIMFLECRRILSEAAELLKYEPVFIPEGKIAIQVEARLLDTDIALRNMSSSVGDIAE